MEQMDKHDDELHSENFSDEEQLLHEVIQGDADLYYLHHYLTETFRKEAI